jgi:hypothetical protein
MDAGGAQQVSARSCAPVDPALANSLPFGASVERGCGAVLWINPRHRISSLEHSRFYLLMPIAAEKIWRRSLRMDARRPGTLLVESPAMALHFAQAAEGGAEHLHLGAVQLASCFGMASGSAQQDAVNGAITSPLSRRRGLPYGIRQRRAAEDY